MLFDTARDAEPEDVFSPIVFQIFISYKYILAAAPVVFFEKTASVTRHD